MLSQVSVFGHSPGRGLTHILYSIVTRGISSHLMKSVSKRRRSKYQIQEDKRREEQKKAETKRRLD